MKILTAVSTVVAATLLLSSCAGESGTSPTAASREAQARGTRICVINNSSLKMSILWRGYPDARDIPPGGQNCNSGYESQQADVQAALEYQPSPNYTERLTWNLWGYNSAIASPEATVYTKSQGKTYGMNITGVVGVSTMMQKDALRGDLVRVPDSEDSREYVLTLTNASGSDFAAWILPYTEGY